MFHRLRLLRQPRFPVLLSVVFFANPLHFFYMLDSEGYIQPAFESIFYNKTNELTRDQSAWNISALPDALIAVEYHHSYARLLSALHYQTLLASRERFRTGAATEPAAQLSALRSYYGGLTAFELEDWQTANEMLGAAEGKGFELIDLYRAAAMAKTNKPEAEDLFAALTTQAATDDRLWLEWSLMSAWHDVAPPPARETAAVPPAVSSGSSPRDFKLALGFAVSSNNVDLARKLLAEGPSLDKAERTAEGGLYFFDPGLIRAAAEAHQFIELNVLERLVSLPEFAGDRRRDVDSRIADATVALRLPGRNAGSSTDSGSPYSQYAGSLQGTTALAPPSAADDPWMWTAYARALGQAGRWQESLDAGRRAIEQMKQTVKADAWERAKAVQIAACPALTALFALERYDEANQLANELIIGGGEDDLISANDVPFLLHWARAKRHQGQSGYPKAMSCYTRLLQITPAARQIVEHFRVVYAAMATYLEAGQIK